MNFIKLFIVFFLLSIIFRFLFKKWLTNLLGPLQKRGEAGRTQAQMVKDTIIPCPTCGTYNPSKEAYFYKEKYYCNQNCFEKSLQS